jgi:hypothetical protein
LASGEEFVLTEPGMLASAEDPGEWGHGWFRISAPSEGWIYSKYVAGVGADYPADCSLHDGLEPREQG